MTLAASNGSFDRASQWPSSSMTLLKQLNGRLQRNGSFNRAVKQQRRSLAAGGVHSSGHEWRSERAAQSRGTTRAVCSRPRGPQHVFIAFREMFYSQCRGTTRAVATPRPSRTSPSESTIPAHPNSPPSDPPPPLVGFSAGLPRQLRGTWRVGDTELEKL